MTVYSHSRLSTFEQCALKFKYKYIDKVETEVEQSVEAFMGSHVHKALEKLYKDMKFQKTNTLEEILAYFNIEWKKNWNKEIIIVRKDYTEENYRKMGEQFLTDYYKKYHPFTSAKIIDLEKKIAIKLDSNGIYQMQGYIDRLASPYEGVYEIHDYKTNASLPIQEYLEEDRQLALYSIAVKQMYQDAKEVKLIWHFLASNKEVVIIKTDEQLEKLKKNTIELINKIESEKEFKSKPSSLCEWCQFRPICPEWSHLYKLEKKTADKYLGDDGVQLVNKYAELYNQKEHIQNEMDRIKDAIVNFSKENKVTTIFGSEHKTKVYTYQNLKFPSSDDPQRGVMEKIIDQFGLSKQVSRVDLIKLSNIIKSGQLPEEISKELEKFYTKEETNIVKISKFEKKEF